MGPRAQPVTIAVQEHQDHTIGPAKPLLERGEVSGARSLGKAPKSFYGVWDPHLEALALHSPRGTREHQSASSLGPTSMEETEAQREEVMVSCRDSRAPKFPGGCGPLT